MTARSPGPSAPASARLLPDLRADAPLELPPAWTPPARQGVPLLASVVPVLGAVALWAVTGSVLSLWLAALGPLIAVATMADAARAARRDRRRADRTAFLARERVVRAIDDRHAEERDRRWSRHPDVAGFLAREGEIWRAVPDRADALVVGSGSQPSGLRVTGGGDEPASVEVRDRAATLERAPAIVSPSAGVAVVGDAVLGSAVVRALVLQVCLARPPGAITITGALRGENAWAERLPHRARSRSSAGVASTVLVLVGPDEEVPDRADIAIVRVDPGTPPPARCRVVLTVRSPARAVLDVDGDISELSIEAVGAGQAAAIADELAERAGRTVVSRRSDEPVDLSSLLDSAPAPARGALPAVIGTESGEPRVVDLVGDGPHAIVAGVTGSGKSELLISWVLSLCAGHSTRQVSFLLADFKGGTAFDSLATLPNVTGVLTDLDGAGARRAIESLRAEVRWREAELARCGARDILDPRVELPRLVIVVDEFAALLGDHPELHAVFSDVAARGRALGVHLVLGTQRPSGVMRESLLANCPLRISLRVNDPADSRVVLGTSEAAELPGGADGRGVALMRTAADVIPRRVRIALSHRDDIERIVQRAGGPPPRRPWLPELPTRVHLEELIPSPTASEAEALVLGLADEPENQRQLPAVVRIEDRGLLVIGGAGSGRSTALRTLAAQAPSGAVWIPADGEGAWDAVADLVRNPPARGSVVLIDDLDALMARMPHDYALELADRLDRVMRTTGEAGYLVVAAVQRLSGSAARLADLLPRRLVLAAASRADYIAAGGDPHHHVPGDGAGRGRLAGRAVQVAISDDLPLVGPPPSSAWVPLRPLSGFVARRSPTTRASLADWEAHGVRVLSVDDFVAQAGWPDDDRVVVFGDPEEWQRSWRALTSVRTETDLVIDAACAPEWRMLSGERSLPPYCEPGRARAWLISAGASPERIQLPTGTAPSASRA
ncbi:FtsK/SpoIIIE domain-containing protein [Microbacterium pygmaeum]|uniref:DNA segregation ATPase FtsK/SpoIIIE, S-DNA-T family n=1 Tax=Microbacterium pygmaeum TaxID=370764 RepID=A0A1G8C908_9MICO|nr:FtsK/SpoIIIE domain-containing protein [Microbacterium pygmaeum]SDH41852.1 DNA segregation ATPase FtsK/SpoIIIE, S-DNA-T family [Microbacterium pygmaeum]